MIKPRDSNSTENRGTIKISVPQVKQEKIESFD